jgi:hypothetical protein
MLKKLMASWHKFWIRSRTRDDGAHGRIIVERLLEMSRHPPVGTTSGADDADDEPERKEA